MKAHFGAVLTSGLAAVALALAVLQAVVLTHSAPLAAQQESAAKAVPWTPAPREGRAPPSQSPRHEHHTAPPRGRGFPFNMGPRPARRAAA